MLVLILKYVVCDFCTIMKLGTIVWWVGFCSAVLLHEVAIMHNHPLDYNHNIVNMVEKGEGFVKRKGFE